MGIVRFVGRGSEETVVEIGPDETILRAAWRSGVEIPTKCGGNGLCAWCTQTIRSGIEHVIGLPQYNPHDQDGKTRAKTCQMKVAEDGEVVIEP
ncbi:2Fe-2S iron-sulfur cluster binding domain-containing protein [Candidatus Peregrinibacteria bacterium]|nr:2Fe-2S iron-sulfur cluster binding domain-containing protein [Candidatus Peregrinibacteria bacterium]